MPTTGETWYSKAKWNVFKREDVAYTFGEDTLIRYVECTDARELESALDYIATLATFSNPVVEGNGVGGTWVTLTTWYEEGRPFHNQRTLRLYHALIPQGGSTGDGPYVVENNCTYRVSFTFYWRQTALPTVTAGSTGVTYSIQAVNRDQRSGLYNFIIEKREQITTKIAEYVVSDNDFEKVTEQAFFGVRETSAGSGGYTQGYNGTTTATISGLWDPDDTSTQGTRYTQSINKNPNCTADLTQRKIVAKGVNDATKEYTKDVYEKRVTLTDRNQATAVADYVAVANGIVTEQRAEQQPDGTFNNVEVKNEEITESVGVDPEAFKAQTETLAETTLTQEHASQTAQAAMSNFSGVTEGTLYEKSSRKTKAGRFLHRIVTTVAKLWSARIYRMVDDGLLKRTIQRDEGVASSALNDYPTVQAVDGVYYDITKEQRPDKKYNVEVVRHDVPVTSVLEKALTNTIFESEATLRNYVVPKTKNEPVANDPVSGTPGLIERDILEAHEGNVWVNRKIGTVERAVASSEVVTEVRPGLKVISTTDTNATAAFTTSDLANTYGTIRNTKTPGNRYVRTKTEPSNVTAGTVIAHEKTGDYFSTMETKVTIETSDTFGTTGLANGGEEATANIVTERFENRGGYFEKTWTKETVAAGQIIPYTVETQIPAQEKIIKEFINKSLTWYKNEVAIANTQAISFTHDMVINKFGLCSGVFTFLIEA